MKFSHILEAHLPLFFEKVNKKISYPLVYSPPPLLKFHSGYGTAIGSTRLESVWRLIKIEKYVQKVF